MTGTIKSHRETTSLTRGSGTEHYANITVTLGFGHPENWAIKGKTASQERVKADLDIESKQ